MQTFHTKAPQNFYDEQIPAGLKGYILCLRSTTECIWLEMNLACSIAYGLSGSKFIIVARFIKFKVYFTDLSSALLGDHWVEQKIKTAPTAQGYGLPVCMCSTEALSKHPIAICSAIFYMTHSLSMLVSEVFGPIVGDLF